MSSTRRPNDYIICYVIEGICSACKHRRRNKFESGGAETMR